jgi:hypothetical protein
VTDQNAPVPRRKGSAKEHLAGLAAARAFHQELAAAHLLRTQSPISAEPYGEEQEASK